MNRVGVNKNAFCEISKAIVLKQKKRKVQWLRQIKLKT